MEHACIHYKNVLVKTGPTLRRTWGVSAGSALVALEDLVTEDLGAVTVSADVELRH
jgi:hypothetical protein